MNSTALLFGILPLLLFVIIDSFFGLKKGLVAAIILAFIEAVYTYITFGSLDFITGFTFLIILLMSVLSFKSKKEIYFLMAPVIMSASIGLILIITYLSDYYLFYEIAVKYKELLPIDPLSHPFFVKMLKLFSFTGGIGFLVHSLVTYIAAVKLSKWWWIAIRGIGFYIILGIASLITQMMVKL